MRLARTHRKREKAGSGLDAEDDDYEATVAAPGVHVRRMVIWA